MRMSQWTLAILLCLFGIMLIYFSRQGDSPPHPLTYICGGLLILAGAAVFLRRSFAYYLALGAGLFTLGVALGSFVVKQELVPTPPVTAVMGLLVSVRVVVSRSFERREERRAAERAARTEGREPDEEE